MRVITALANKKNSNILLELKEFLVLKHPEIDLKMFFSAPFVIQLGIYLEFFEDKNFTILATPNSYAIEFVNYEINSETKEKVKELILNTKLPFIVTKYDLKLNDILLVYELAIVELINYINKPPF